MARIQSKKRTRHDRLPEILVAAREVLEKQGVSGFSIPDVAERAAVSEAAVFYYFPTRRELVFRVISDWMEPVIERLEVDIAHVSGSRERLVWFIARHLREAQVTPKLHELIYRELHWESYYTSTLHRLNQRYTHIVLWIINQGQACGEIRDSADAQLTRDLLFGALHHVSWRTVLNGRALDIERTAEQLGEQIYLGVCTTAPTQSAKKSTDLQDAIARLEQLADRLEARI